MKAVVTGGGGFVGRGITLRLRERGDEVTVVARGTYPDLERRGVRVVQADLCTDAERVADALADVDVVFHVAARAGIWGPYHEYHGVNVEGTRAVLDGMRRHGVGRLVYTSSPSVTFDGRDAVNADEQLPYPEQFENAYSESKATAEKMVLQAAKDGELAAVALRPHLIWGPGDPHLIPRLVRAARAHQLRQVGDGKNMVDVTYVDNVVDAHLLAADRLRRDSPLNGRPYFISNDEPVELWPWLNRLLQRLGAPPVKGRISVSAARFMGGILEAAYRTFSFSGEPRMTRFLAAQLGTSHYYDISAAKRDFGYAPRVKLEEGLDRLVEWYRQHPILS